MSMWRNPWLWTLWVAGALMFIVGLVVAGSPDLLGGGAQLLQWGTTILLAALVVSALLWRPLERVDEPEQAGDHEAQR